MHTAAVRKPLFQRLFPYLLVAPTLILVTLFTIYPAVNSVFASLTRPGRSPNDAPSFVGIQNYLDLFTTSHYLGANFTQVLGNTILFATVTMVVSLPVALIFALLLNRRMRGTSLWRFSLFYPSLLPLLGIASIWAFIFADGIGPLSVILARFGIDAPNWTGDPNLALATVTFVNIWKQIGYFMIFYLAGLQSIPKELFEAAALEGATVLQQTVHLTVPLLRRTTLFILVIGFTYAFQTVEHLAALGQGGPGQRSNLLLYYIFQTIPERRNWGYVNAMTVVLVLILLVFTVTSFFMTERGREHD